MCQRVGAYAQSALQVINHTWLNQVYASIIHKHREYVSEIKGCYRHCKCQGSQHAFPAPCSHMKTCIWITVYVYIIKHCILTLNHYCMYGGAWIVINESSHVSVGFSYMHGCFYSLSKLNDTYLSSYSNITDDISRARIQQPLPHSPPHST